MEPATQPKCRLFNTYYCPNDVLTGFKVKVFTLVFNLQLQSQTCEDVLVIQTWNISLLDEGWMTKTWNILKLINSCPGKVHASFRLLRLSLRLKIHPGDFAVRIKIWMWLMLKECLKRNKKKPKTLVSNPIRTSLGLHLWTLKRLLRKTSQKLLFWLSMGSLFSVEGVEVTSFGWVCAQWVQTSRP